MKYALNIIIDAPVDRVIELYDEPANLEQWMDGLEEFKSVKGTPREAGSTAKLKFRMGKRVVEMMETVKVKNPPHEFTFIYEADKVYNILSESFSPAPENKTKYTSMQEFHFKGFMKVFAFFMSAIFKKQSMKYMKNFKVFAEKHA